MWFLWMLLLFDCLAAASCAIAPRWGDALGRAAGTVRRPVAAFWILVGISAAVYVPMAVFFGAGSWREVGPLSFQESRPLLYAVYFLAGAGVGAHGIDRGLLSADGALARRWPRWLVAASGAFAVALTFFVIGASRASRGEPQSAALEAAWSSSFVVSCAASSFFFLALFVRFASAGRGLGRLSAEAYGMYVTHFVFVSWLQYALLQAPLPAVAKGSVVFLAAVASSYGATVGLRRIPAVGRVL